MKCLALLVFTGPVFNSTDALSEATEMEYLRKVFFEYMMGRETKVCCIFIHKIYFWIEVLFYKCVIFSVNQN